MNITGIMKTSVSAVESLAQKAKKKIRRNLNRLLH
jgi:DNA-directed RNA polymerase specialized sigma24 family protein